MDRKDSDIQASDEKKRGRLFYGWWIVIACATIALIGGGNYNYGMTVYFRPLMEEFHWSATTISVAFGLRSMEAGMAAPLFGYLVDRVGPRKLLFLGMVTAGMAFILFSRVNSLPTFYLAFFMLAFGWTPANTVVSVNAVARWFRKRVSLALGLLAVGTGAGATLVPIVAWMVSNYGWRQTSFTVGLIVLAVCVPLSLVVRDWPGDLGYRPYGLEGEGTPGVPHPADGKALQNSEYSVRRALRTPDFWFITLAFSACFAMANAVTAHHMPYLESIGFDTTSAAWVLSLSGVASVAGRLVFGWLGDFADKRRLVAGVVVLQTIAILALAIADSLPLVIVYAVAFGLGWGGSIPLRSAIILERFGRKAFGTIQGTFFFLATTASTISPIFVGQVFDMTQNYRPAFFALGGFLMVTGPLILLVRLRPAR